MARGKEKPQVQIEPAGLAPSEGMVGVRARREYDNTRIGYLRTGQRTMIPAEVAKQVFADHGKDGPLELVEYTDEEKAEIEKALESPENKSLESPEKK